MHWERDVAKRGTVITAWNCNKGEAMSKQPIKRNSMNETTRFELSNGHLH